MKRLLVSLCFAIALLGPGDGHADAIDDLKSPDVDVRRVAIDKIQTLDDPRIPAACLPLLNDEGLSIRRLAARAIGSRFYQISDADRSRYLEAVEACLGSNYDGPEDITLMSQRAIGLLSRQYSSPPFSISPNGKWVLYERRRRPVIANISQQQHYLLAPIYPDYYGPDDPSNSILKTEETNLTAEQLFAPHWHSDGQAVAFMLERLEARFYHPILVWSAKAPSRVVVLDEKFFRELLRARKPQYGDTTRFVAWKGDKVLVRLYDCDPLYGESTAPELILSYNIRTGRIARER